MAKKAKKAKAAPKSPAAAKMKAAPDSAGKPKPKAVWGANPLAFQTGASDRAERAKAHRRGRA